MYDFQKYYHYVFKAIAIYCAVQGDILLLEFEWIITAPFSLILFIFFLIKKDYIFLAALFFMSLPLSVLNYHIPGLHLCFYILLYFLNILLQQSIYIKKLIPYLLFISFLILQNFYFYLCT